MDEDRFWAMIEDAWQAVGGRAKARQKLAAGTLDEERLEALVEDLDAVIPALRSQLERLPADELLAFDRILERKLYDIDRADVHEYADGSDDGFLYGRGFIVAVGRGYYEAVSRDPSLAVPDSECEEMCYLSWHLHRERFGEVPPSGIGRESCSNLDAWPAGDDD